MSDTAFQCLDCKRWKDASERSPAAIQSCKSCQPGLRTTPRRAVSDDADAEDADD